MVYIGGNSGTVGRDVTHQWFATQLLLTIFELSLNKTLNLKMSTKNKVKCVLETILAT